MNHPHEPGEHCFFPDCQAMATHKLAEDAVLVMHEMTTYLCCTHMRAIRMDCSKYPYHMAMTSVHWKQP